MSEFSVSNFISYFKYWTYNIMRSLFIIVLNSSYADQLVKIHKKKTLLISTNKLNNFILLGC